MATGVVTDADAGISATRAQRASVGLAVLAAVLLACGAAVEVTAGMEGSPVSGPVPPVRPSPTVSVAPPVCLPGRNGPIVCLGEIRLPHHGG